MNEAELAKMIADAQRRRSYVTLLELLDHYLANYPPTGVYHYLRAEALRALGRLDEAEAELLKATAPSDKQYLIHLALGMIYEVKGKLADAEAQFRAAVESRKNDVVPLTVEG